MPAAANMAIFSQDVFRYTLSKTIVKHVRLPTKKDLGTKVTKSKPIASTLEVLQEMLSEANGLPHLDKGAGIQRTESGYIKPTKTTSAGDVYTIKLQVPSHIEAALRLHERAPKRGWGAAKLNLGAGKERKGQLAKSISMAAAPVRLRTRIPQGKAATRNLPSVILSLNRVHLNLDGEVTFGVKGDEYALALKKLLRARIYTSDRKSVV